MTFKPISWPHHQLLSGVCQLGRKLHSFVPGYYVDATNGSDSNDGLTTSTPWQTISKVNGETFNPGDHIYFKRGEIWRETLTPPSDGDSSQLITFGAYGSGDLPIITATDLIAGWTNFAANVWQATVTTEPNIVLFDGTVGTLESGTGTINAANEWFWAANVLYVYSTSDPDTAFTSPGIEAGARNSCITLNSRNYVRVENFHVYGQNQTANAGAVMWNQPADNITLRNLTIEKNRFRGVQCWNSGSNIIDGCTIDQCQNHGILCQLTASGQTGNNNIIINNTVSNCNRVGIDVWGFNAAERSTGHTIDGNTISNCGDGIYLHRVNSSTISNNTILDTDGTAVGAEGLGLGVQAGSSLTFESNEVGRSWNRGIEIWGDGGATDGPSDANILRYNLFYANGDQAKLIAEGGGVFLSSDQVTNTEIYYNIIYDHKGYISFVIYGIFGTGTGHTIYNNVIFENYVGIAPWEADADSWTIKNNIIADSQLRHVDITTGVTGDYDYNLYYPDGAALFRWAGSNYNFADWKTNSSHDANSPAIADPLFTDDATHDFHLQSGSPARNVGTDVSLTRDYDGVSVPQETNPAIGAYEYVS